MTALRATETDDERFAFVMKAVYYGFVMPKYGPAFVLRAAYSAPIDKPEPSSLLIGVNRVEETCKCLLYVTISRLAHSNHIYLEGGGNIRFRNVDSTAHFHTMHGHKSKININSTLNC
jgi:hypothetical protein